MSNTKVKGNQIEGITNDSIDASAAIATSKLADGSKMVLNDGTVAMAAALSMNSHKITGVSAPTEDADAANKQYVDQKAQGLDPKESVRLAATGDLGGTYNGGTQRITAGSNGALSLDGVAVAEGDRVLVKDQTTEEENGIYVVIDTGDAGSPFILERADDFDSSDDISPGAHCFISEGNTLADTQFVLTTDAPIVLDTTELTFSQFSGAADVVAGDGLTKSGNTINVGAGDGIVSNADTIAVDVTDFIDTSYGLTEDTNNIRINLDSNPGLEFNSGALRVKVGDGLSRGATGVLVDVTDIIDTAAGLTESSNNIQVNLAATGGLEFSGGAIQLDLKSNGGLSLSGNELQLNATYALLKANYIAREVVNETPNGVLTEFTVDYAFVTGSEQVFRNGILQLEGAGNDYVATPGSGTITFTTGPLTGDIIQVAYIKA